MAEIVSHISNFIEDQFPEFYQENGPMFIEFVKTYYQWLETNNNPLDLSRKYYDNKEIDSTSDDFIVYFKNKYLVDIKFDTQADLRTLVKHSLDIYRSKGTEQELKLLFNLVFGKDIEVYYPSKDLFGSSDGEWYIPTYLQLSLSGSNLNFNHKEIKGFESGATAYVESIVRKRYGTTLCDVAYISNVRGDFVAGEKIYPTDNSIDVIECPYFLGCVNEVTLPTSGVGSGYVNGDIIEVIGTHGVGAKAKVTSTMSQSGYVNFELEDGGYGYTINSTVYISNAILGINNTKLIDGSKTVYSTFKGDIVQPKVYLNYEDASGSLIAGANVYTYYGNNDLMGQGVVLSNNPITANTGTLLCSELSGSLNNTFHTYSNAVIGSLTLVNGYSNAYATGVFIANTANTVVNISSVSGSFIEKEWFVQSSGKGKISTVYNNTLYLDEVEGIIKDGDTGYGSFTGAFATVDSTLIKIGLINTDGTFYSSSNGYVYGDNFTGDVVTVDTVGSGAGYSISPTLLYEETVSLANNEGLPPSSTLINAAAYGFPGNPTANLTSGTIGSCFEYFSANVGKIKDIIITGVGSDYINPPMYVVDELMVSDLGIDDVILEVTYNGQNFANGELVTQGDARGIIQKISNTTIYIQRMRVEDSKNFIVTSNTATLITGYRSSATANVVTVSKNTNNPVLGRNAKVLSEIVAGNGIANGIAIIDSGFNYIQSEAVLTADGEVLGNIVLSKQGKSEGYYKKLGSEPSGVKKLFDGDYYQNYSYEIISAILMDKYVNMVNQVAHVAGTKMFGKLSWNSNNDCTVSISTEVTTE